MNSLAHNARPLALTASSRVYRAGIGAALIATILFYNPLTAEWMYLLPLLAVYFIVSAIMASDPINALAAQWGAMQRMGMMSPAWRVALISVGCVLIGTSAFSNLAAQLPSWLSLAAIPLVLTGLFGEDLLRAMLDEPRNYNKADSNPLALSNRPTHFTASAQAGGKLFGQAA